MSLQSKIVDIYKGIAFSRNDDLGDVYYFSAEDFKGLNARHFEFKGSKNQTLRGYFYFYNEMNLSRIVIFEHGMGGGHRSYMKEIEMLASFGYTVLSYDHTGCMSSDGEGTGGFSTSLADLDFCLRALKSSDEYRNTKFSVIGHSWGGYSAMNIGSIHPDVTHIVVISGFISVNRLLGQFFSGIMKDAIPALFELETESNRHYADADGIRSMHRTRAKALFIYSSNDSTVKKKHHFNKLKSNLADRPNTEFLLLKGKDHNPNYTKNAVRYKNRFFKKLTKARKKGKLRAPADREKFKNSFDWNRMTEQDQSVWQVIKTFLEK